MGVVVVVRQYCDLGWFESAGRRQDRGYIGQAIEQSRFNKGVAG